MSTLIRRLWNKGDLTDEGCAIVALLVLAAIMAALVL